MCPHQLARDVLLIDLQIHHCQLGSTAMIGTLFLFNKRIAYTHRFTTPSRELPTPEVLPISSSSIHTRIYAGSATDPSYAHHGHLRPHVDLRDGLLRQGSGIAYRVPTTDGRDRVQHNAPGNEPSLNGIADGHASMPRYYQDLLVPASHSSSAILASVNIRPRQEPVRMLPTQTLCELTSAARFAVRCISI